MDSGKIYTIDISIIYTWKHKELFINDVVKLVKNISTSRLNCVHSRIELVHFWYWAMQV